MPVLQYYSFSVCFVKVFIVNLAACKENLLRFHWSLPEFIDPVFAKTSPIGSIYSGTGMNRYSSNAKSDWILADPVFKILIRRCSHDTQEQEGAQCWTWAVPRLQPWTMMTRSCSGMPRNQLEQLSAFLDRVNFKFKDLSHYGTGSRDKIQFFDEIE